MNNIELYKERSEDEKYDCDNCGKSRDCTFVESYVGDAIICDKCSEVE